MIQNINFHLTIYEVIYSMVLAFFITCIILFINFYRKITMECIYPKQRFFEVIKNFNEVFPKDAMYIKGEKFKKGMQVRVITFRKNVYEGKIIGFNHKNIICIETQDAIVTNKFKNIQEINVLEQLSTNV